RQPLACFIFRTLRLPLASRPSGLDQEARPLGTPFSPKSKGAGGQTSPAPSRQADALRGRQWFATPGAHPFGARLRLRSAAACAPAIDLHYARTLLYGRAASSDAAAWTLHASCLCRRDMGTMSSLRR